jgi:hypothetical protein
MGPENRDFGALKPLGKKTLEFRSVEHQSTAAGQTIAPLFGVGRQQKNLLGTLADY